MTINLKKERDKQYVLSAMVCFLQYLRTEQNCHTIPDSIQISKNEKEMHLIAENMHVAIGGK